MQQMLQDHAEDLGAGMTDSALHFEHEHDANWTRRKNFAPPKKVPTDPRTTSRPGAEWPYGPVTKAKSVEHDLATYVRWVQEVEHAYGSSNEVVLQRLRRLYYSSYGGALGDKFDAVIGDQPDAGGPPLDSRSISIEALDGLYETGTVRTPDGDSIDVSHILAILDLKTAGKSIRAVGASELRDVDWAGVLTWTGDLAWLFIQWVIRRHELDAAAGAAPATDAGPADVAGGIDRTIVIETARASSARRIVVSARDMALLDELAKIKSSKDDLLGDIDGTVIAARSLRGPPPNLVMPVSKILEQYYAHRGEHPDGDQAAAFPKLRPLRLTGHPPRDEQRRHCHRDAGCRECNPRRDPHHGALVPVSDVSGFLRPGGYTHEVRPNPPRGCETLYPVPRYGPGDGRRGLAVRRPNPLRFKSELAC